MSANRGVVYVGPGPVEVQNIDDAKLADIVNARIISLEDAPQGYQSFDEGAATKFVLDPHGMLQAA